MKRANVASWFDQLVSELCEGAPDRRDEPIPFALTARARQLLEADDQPIPYEVTELGGAVVAGACRDCGGYPGHLVGGCVCTGGGW